MARLSCAVPALVLAAGACVGNVMEAEPHGADPWLDASGQLAPEGGASLSGPDGSSSGAYTGGGAGSNPDDAAVSWSSRCNGAEPLAGDLRVREVSFYQVVKIPVFEGDTWVSARNASIVQGKKALVRTFVEPLTSYRPRLLRAVLSVANDGHMIELTAEKTLVAASTDESADSTFDFTLDGALIGPHTQLSVAIVEPSCQQAPSFAASRARVPATGLQALGAVRIGALRVVLVPVEIGGRVPDTGAAQLARIRDELLAYYPVADVEVTAHAPISWAGRVRADSSGWSELLNEIGLQRERDAPPRDTYYFGLVTPAASFSEYCGTSCVLGMAPQTAFVSAPDQIGLGLGFSSANTFTTIVHELAHAHGRGHAPCARGGGPIPGVDPRFPYSGASIGSWGWDSRSGKLMSPARHRDVMSYCDPTWISDFNYESLLARARNVNTAASVLTTKASVTTWQRVIVFADGRARWAGVTTTQAPTDRSTAYVLGEGGQQLGAVEVAYVPLSHSSDTFLYVPEPDPAWSGLQLQDRVLVFAEIEPAR